MEGEEPYSEKVRALFGDPLHAGRLASGREARFEGQGVRVILSVEDDGRVVAGLRFLAWGCPHFIAACEAFCEAWEGRELAALSGFSAVELIEELEIPVEKTGRLLVLEDAVRSLAA